MYGCVCLCGCVCVWVCVCLHVCLFVCMYVCVYYNCIIIIIYSDELRASNRVNVVTAVRV